MASTKTPTTTTKAPSKLKVTTTKSPNSNIKNTSTTTPRPITTTQGPIMEIKLGEKINGTISIKNSTKEFLCNVEGLNSIDFFSDPYGLPDIFAIYGLKDISEARSNSLDGLLKHISTKAETKKVEVTKYKYIKITVNRDINVNTNDFSFVITPTKNETITTTTTTTTKMPVVPIVPKPTTTKMPILTTKAPVPVKIDTTNTALNTLIKLNTKVTDFDKSKINSYLCNINGLTKTSVFMNPFKVQNHFIINGVDANDYATKLFSASWSGSFKLVPVDVSKYKYLQIIIDNSIVSSNAFEIRILGDEKLLKK